MSRHRIGPSGAPTDGVFKWVVRITSLLTLVFALVQAVRLVSDVRDRRRQIDELLKVQQLQEQSSDYAGAWATLEQALKVAESSGQLAKLTGQVGTDVQRVRVAQEDLAMVWTENPTAPTAEKYAAVVAQLTPVMTRGAASSSGVRKADLQSHVGLAGLNVAIYTSASSRDSGPEGACRAALADDPSNPYAHSCIGYWMLWARKPIDEAMREFSAAIAANRARPFVRQLQWGALDRRGDPARLLIVGVANDMRKNGEPMPSALRSNVYSVYYFACGSRENPEGMRDLLGVVPATEQAATYQALFIDTPEREVDESRSFIHQACLATLLEAAGDRDRALATWRHLREDLGSRPGHTLTPRADAAIKRLSM